MGGICSIRISVKPLDLTQTESQSSYSSLEQLGMWLMPTITLKDNIAVFRLILFECITVDSVHSTLYVFLY